MIRDMVPDDLPGIADLHAKVFGEPEGPEGKEGVASFYRDAFLEHPFPDCGMGSQVVLGPGGAVTGFLGIIPRRFRFRDRELRMAILGRFMFDPGTKDPLAPIRLVRKVLKGPFDFVWSDGANRQGMETFTASRARVVPILSLNWVRLLNPLRGLAAMKRWDGSLPGRGFRILAFPLDLVGSRVLGRAGRRGLEGWETMDVEGLLESIETASKPSILKPVYDHRECAWLLRFLERQDRRGRFLALEWQGTDPVSEAWVLAYLRPNGVLEVLQFGVRRGDPEAAFEALLAKAADLGAHAVTGRSDPRFQDLMWRHRAFLKQGSWAVLHTTDPELELAVQSGRAFLTALEGELHLPSAVHGH